MKYSLYSECSDYQNIRFTTPTFDSKKPYVLVVEDDYAILTVIMMLFEMEGYPALGILEGPRVVPFLLETQSAGSLDNSLALPAVILLDLMMANVSDYESVAQLAEHLWSMHIPLIVMTADVNKPETVINGVHDWIGKPFHIDLLLSKVTRYLPSSVCL